MDWTTSHPVPYVDSCPCTSACFEENVRLFLEERVFTINPDAFLNRLIAQISVLISNDPERYRSVLVRHSEKKTITVDHGADMWKNFISSIDIVDTRLKSLLTREFSTTTDDVMVARYGMIMAMFAPYYPYAATGLRAVSETFDWKRMNRDFDCFDIFTESKMNYGKPVPPCLKSKYCRVDDPVENWFEDTKETIAYFIAITKGNLSDEVYQWCEGFLTKSNESGGRYVGRMVLLDRNGEVIDDKSRPMIIVTNMPSLMINFHVGGSKHYLIGNFHSKTKGDHFCLAKPEIRQVITEV